MSVLKEVKNTQQTKLSLIKAKDKVADALQEEEEEPKPEPVEELKKEPTQATTEAKNEAATQTREPRQALTVRVTEG